MSKIQWTEKTWNPCDALTIPLRTKKPTMWFVNSMSDLFHEAVPFEFIDKVFAVMALTPQHTYQILTKRPERMAEYLARLSGFYWPLLNVWLGTSIEDQKRADERIPHLLQCPATVRFLSCEPLLGPINLQIREVQRFEESLGGPLETWGYEIPDGIHWVIVGGESGDRPMDIEWARSLVRQCAAAGVACFVKQLGAYITPEDLRIRQFPEVAHV